MDGFLEKLEVNVNSKDVCKSIDKVTDTISRGAGWILSPVHRMMDAAASQCIRVLEAETDGQLEAIALKRAARREMQRAETLERITTLAAARLPEYVSAEAVDPAWSTRFVSAAQDASTDELRQAWARILASEVAVPRSISKRTLRVMEDLDSVEARLFSHLSQFAMVDINDGAAMVPLIERPGAVAGQDFDALRDWGVSFRDRLRLQDAGLVVVDHLLANRVTGDTKFRVGRSVLAVSAPAGRCAFGILQLSNEGRELLHICDPVTNVEFVRALKVFLTQRGCTVEEA